MTLSCISLSSYLLSLWIQIARANNSAHNLTSTSQITSNIKYCNFTCSLQRNHRHARTQKDYPSSDLCTFLFICTDLQWTTSDTGTFNTQKQGPRYTRKTTVVYKQSRRRISSSLVFFFCFFFCFGGSVPCHLTLGDEKSKPATRSHLQVERAPVGHTDLLSWGWVSETNQVSHM